MLAVRSVKKIHLYQAATVGLYFFYWCARAGGEVNNSLNRRVVPSAWFFLIPYAGAFWWVWKFAEGLDEATQRYIKRSDTFLWFILASLAWWGGVGGFHGDFSSSGDHDTIWTLIVFGYLAVGLVVNIVLYGVFCAVTQKKINQYLTRNPSPNLPKQG